MGSIARIGTVALLALGAPHPAAAVPDAPPRPGEIIEHDEIRRLRPWLPRALWYSRQYLFHPRMRLEVGPAHRDYSPPPVYQVATERYAGGVRLGPDGSLVGYVAGQPFPADGIDCDADPSAGTKWLWNVDYQWDGAGDDAHFLYTIWNRGERQRTFFEGHLQSTRLSHRAEPSLLERRGGDVFRGDARKSALSLLLQEPASVRGTQIIGYRYKASDGPRDAARRDEYFVFDAARRELTSIDLPRPWDALPGTDVVLEDFRGFAGVVPDYRWTCLDERDLLAPVNSRERGYPYSRDLSFGPLGLSYANDRWELRRAVHVRGRPRDPDHRYSRRELWIDRQTLRILYALTYDIKNELWKVTIHNGRWSEDDPDYYPGWTEVPEPRDAKTVGEITIDVQTRTGVRIEFWDNHGTPMKSRLDVRRTFEPHWREAH